MTAVAYHARWVVPIAEPPIAHGAVVVADGRVAWVGPAALAPAADARVGLGDAILLPGLVNAHTHLELTGMRGFLEGLPFFEWVRTLTAARRDVLSPDDLRHAARLGVAEGLLHGVTTYADTGDSDAPFDAMLALGVRGIAYREVFGPDPAHADAALADLEAKVRGMRARATARVQVGVSPHAPYSVSDALYRATAAFAAREGLPLAVHLAESHDESALVTRGEGAFARFLAGRGIAVAPRGRSPVALLDALEVLGPRTLCIHVVQGDEPDIARLAARGAAVAHCPASNARLGHGVAPLAAWRAAGLRVGLGSDSMASNNVMDLRGEARLAALLAAGRGGDAATAPTAASLAAHDLLALATAGGAAALALDDVGVLRPGARADLAAFRLDPARVAAPDPVAALLWGGAEARAWFVAVDGEPRVQDGVLVGHDLAALAAPVAEQAARLAAWRAASLASP